MATTTTNYGLTKSEQNDYVQIDVINDNMDIIDAELKKRVTADEVTGMLPTDADTVDGKHASDFAEVNHNHDDRYYTESEIDTKMNTKQNSLGFTPVQQGTGTGQKTNTVKIGWSDESRLKVTVDATDLGNVVFDGNLPSSLPANGGNADTVDGYHVNLAIGETALKPIGASPYDLTAGVSELAQGLIYMVYE